MQLYYDKDIDLSIIQNKRVAIIGYGSQGHAHADNLRDSGVKDLIVGVRHGSPSWERAKVANHRVISVSEAVKDADLVALLAPDEVQPQLYKETIEPNIKANAALLFGHGFNIHFGLISPQSNLDVIMVAPKGPGHTVRSAFTRGGGVPTLVAIYQDATGTAKDLVLSYAGANGGGRAGIIETNFREETETDLFGEQAVLCGGVTSLILAGFETLVEAGYAPEMAYFECLHELKLIVDFFYEGGISHMWYTVSNTAEYGGLTRGPVLIDSVVKAKMKEILKEIQTGKFAREFVLENQSGAPVMKSMRRLTKEHMIESVGEKLRSMMPWIKENSLIKEKKS